MNFPNSILIFSFPCSGFLLEAVILPSSVSLRFRCRWPLLPAILNTILWFITFAADRFSSSSQIHTRLNLFEVNALSIAPSVRIFPPPGSACIYGAVGRRLPAIMAVSEALRLSAFDSQSAELSSAVAKLSHNSFQDTRKIYIDSENITLYSLIYINLFFVSYAYFESLAYQYITEVCMLFLVLYFLYPQILKRIIEKT